MAFFRSYLIENAATPDEEFDENDEAALVWFLVQARVRKSAEGLEVPAGYIAPTALPQEFASAYIKKHLKFVSGFLCFFVAKPALYSREIRAFRRYFIPNFANDRDKQIQLGQALHDEFFTASLNDLETAESLDRFFDVTQLYVTA
jgi:hypothetical protein